MLVSNEYLHMDFRARVIKLYFQNVETKTKVT